jgi:hypothetical protein
MRRIGTGYYTIGNTAYWKYRNIRGVFLPGGIYPFAKMFACSMNEKAVPLEELLSNEDFYLRDQHRILGLKRWSSSWEWSLSVS